jgi:hypothetical protein
MVIDKLSFSFASLLRIVCGLVEIDACLVGPFCNQLARLIHDAVEFSPEVRVANVLTLR